MTAVALRKSLRLSSEAMIKGPVWSSSELGALRGRPGGQHAAAQRHEDQAEPVDARERRPAAERPL